MNYNSSRLSSEQQKELFRSVSSSDSGRQQSRTSGELRDAPSFNSSGRQQQAAKKQPVRRSWFKKRAKGQPTVKRGKKELFIGLIKKLFTSPDTPYPEIRLLANRGRFDISLFTVTLILLVFGIVMMSSASYAYSLKNESDSFTYMFQQLQGAAIGFVLMLVAAKVDYHVFLYPLLKPIKWRKNAIRKTRREKNGRRTTTYTPSNGNGISWAHIFFFGSCVLMLLVSFIGDSVNDAKRWISIGSFQFQPSELFKIAAIILAAYMLQRCYSVRKEFVGGFLKYFVIFAPTLVFGFLQRHVSATVIICAIIYVMMIVGGCNSKGIVGLFVLMLIAAVFVVNVWDYIQVRIDCWQHPFSETSGDTYQTSQSLITIGSGGWFGLGLGNSRQKYYYLPESQNDFVFSIICEELGFVGGITVILLFVLFEIRGFNIAAKAKDKFGSFLALGITLQIGLQAMLNIAVACNAIPNTGISLPFFSYGRTALIIQLLEVGILLSVSKESDA